MRYLSPEEIKKTSRVEVKNSLRSHIGKNLQDQFAINLIKRYTVNLEPGHGITNILDLGPASGIFARQIRNRDNHSNFYGVDIDNYIASENQTLFTEFKTADLSIDPIPWPDNTFNIVTAWCVLPHLENPFHAVREIDRVLKPGGIFIFTVPNLSSRASIDYFVKHRDFGSYNDKNNHLVIFTPALVKKTILKYFDLLKIEHHVRSKLFDRDKRGFLRKITLNMARWVSPKLLSPIEKRWAYNTAYVLKKKDLSDNAN